MWISTTSTTTSHFFVYQTLDTTVAPPVNFYQLWGYYFVQWPFRFSSYILALRFDITPKKIPVYSFLWFLPFGCPRRAAAYPARSPGLPIVELLPWFSWSSTLEQVKPKRKWVRKEMAQLLREKRNCSGNFSFVYRLVIYFFGQSMTRTRLWTN